MESFKIEMLGSCGGVRTVKATDEIKAFETLDYKRVTYSNKKELGKSFVIATIVSPHGNESNYKISKII
jgi:hypothetical protein